jgi:hypothetical protein
VRSQLSNAFSLRKLLILFGLGMTGAIETFSTPTEAIS